MQDWFDNDCVAPSSDVLNEADYTPGMSGPVETIFCHDYVEWEFIGTPRTPDLETVWTEVTQ
jgi:hypothetical protein